MSIQSANKTTPSPHDTPRTNRSVGDAWRGLLNLAAGPLRVVLVLVVIAVTFQLLNPNFLNAANLSNLLLQIVPIGLISVGVVIVLLLGEIDLSVGAVSGLAGAVLGVTLVNKGWNVVLAILAALLVGAIIGALQGSAIVALQLPSFIVTLAGLLTWQGAQLWVLGGGGTINVNNKFIVNLSNYFLPDWLSITLLIVGIAIYAALQFTRRIQQQKAGVEVETARTAALRIIGVAVVAAVVAAVLFADRGVPLAFIILLTVILLVNALITATRWGRHLVAVGGNAESARRVGIKVTRVKVVAFAMASTLAAAGGIMAVSRLQAATQGAGGNDLLLLAIAGPVIAGVSLFGGRGSVWGALIGSIVIGAIANGMDLLGLDASIKYIVTGIVLFLAVTLDALARIRRRKQGRL